MAYVRDVLCGQKHNPAWPQEPGTQGCPACGLHVPSVVAEPWMLLWNTGGENLS